jgi:roadblock/LC7 domain-containing protein
MSVKLNHYWSIIPGMDEECVKFIINEFIPVVNKLGIRTVAVWSVLIGAYSEIVLENASSDLENIEKALKSNQYKLLKQNLHQFINNYQSKILINSGKIDSYTMDIHLDTIKFNQMWNIQTLKKDIYDEFVVNEYYPVLNELGILVAGEWEVLIGDGPEIICEGRVTDINNLIKNLQSKKFQKANRELKQYIENYRSRILTLYVKKLN